MSRQHPRHRTGMPLTATKRRDLTVVERMQHRCWPRPAPQPSALRSQARATMRSPAPQRPVRRCLSCGQLQSVLRLPAAEHDATGLSSGERSLGALGDHVGLMLGHSGENVQGELGCSRLSAATTATSPCSNVARKATLRDNLSSWQSAAWPCIGDTDGALLQAADGR